MPDICLVQMPYGAVERPSLSLGLIARYLRDQGLEVDVRYANFAFAEEIGLDVYQMIEKTPQDTFLGEWTFSAAAFPDFAPDHDRYFELAAWAIEESYCELMKATHPGLDVTALLWEVRRRTPGFIDAQARAILATRPRLVGCTSSFQQHCASLALLRRLKELDPGILTMMGGANCEAEMGVATHRAFPWLDFVACGEADAFIGDFCRAIVTAEGGVERVPLPGGMRGPAHRKASAPSRVVLKPAASSAAPPPLADMNRSAIPDFDDYFAQLGASPFAGFVRAGVIVETSRGCWWGQKHHCTFCGLNGGGMVFRSKSPERVMHELDHLASRHGIRKFAAADNILDTQYVRTLLPPLAALDPGYSLFFEVKANLRREHVALLAQSGIRFIQPGIESLHDEVLSRLNKGNDTIINLQLLKWGLELGVRIYWGLLFGVPHEDDAWYREMVAWLPLIHHLQPPDDGIHKIHYDRFSPYHFDAEKYGIRLFPNRRYAYIYPLADAELRELAYYFEDYTDLGRGAIDPVTPGHHRPGLEALAEAVFRWRRLFWRSEETRPRLVLEDDGDGLRIRDTRAVARRAVHHLRGDEAAVHRVCETGTVRHEIGRRLAEQGRPLSAERVGEVVAELIEQRLLLAVGDRVIALAVREPERPLPSGKDIPHGMVSRRVVSDRAAQSLARRFRQPRQAPLAELFAH